MFYYKVKPEITNIYNNELSLNVTAVIHVYTDEAKTDFLMQMPFKSFPFSEIPNKTQEGFNGYVKQKVEEQMAEWTERFEEMKIAKELGLYTPVEPVVAFPEDIQPVEPTQPQE